MEILLRQATSSAMNYAIRSGITITTSYALKQCTRLLQEAPRGSEHRELVALQAQLESKVRIISPAIDMIDLISARGNTSLESAVILTKEIRFDIQSLGTRISSAAYDESSCITDKRSPGKMGSELIRAIADVKLLLSKIEDAVPLINLAITTSGVNLSTKLSGAVSPSRLLQASTFLTAADAKYNATHGRNQQVGPTYTVSLYMLFAAHINRPVNEVGVRETTWKEVMHKAKLKLFRVPLAALYSVPTDKSISTKQPSHTIPADDFGHEFAYQLIIIEDLDDGRYHESAEYQPTTLDEIDQVGICDVVPVHEISKIFYADTGKILKIGRNNDVQSPVLLIRRDTNADAPRRMASKPIFSRSCTPFEDADSWEKSPVDSQANVGFPHSMSKGSSDGLEQTKWRLPITLDQEWMAFEVFGEDDEDDDDYDIDEIPEELCSRDSGLASEMSKLQLRSFVSSSPLTSSPTAGHPSSTLNRDRLRVKTSLSLMEMILKLTALQQFKQESHLSIEDELLNFFLEESSTAGSGPDKDYRQRLRHNAVGKVGFDPYDESPIKLRTEQHIYRGHANHVEGESKRLFNTRFDKDDDVFESIEPQCVIQPAHSSPSPSDQILKYSPNHRCSPRSLGIQSPHETA